MIIKKTVREYDPKKFDREYQKAIDEGWTLINGPEWRHSPYGSFKMAFFRKEVNR